MASAVVNGMELYYERAGQGAPVLFLNGSGSTLKLPAGDYYAWVACESLTAKALRRQLIADHGANPKWTRAAGYWRRGVIAVHEMHDE